MTPFPRVIPIPCAEGRERRYSIAWNEMEAFCADFSSPLRGHLLAPFSCRYPPPLYRDSFLAWRYEIFFGARFPPPPTF